jgi:hypothetical protein
MLKKPPNTAAQNGERTLKAIADGEYHLRGWECSGCAWMLDKPADPTPDILQDILASFEEHDCAVFRKAS